MLRLIFYLLLCLAHPALAANYCNPDGTLQPTNEYVTKLFVLHYANRNTPLPDLKKQTDNYNITYNIPACDADGHILPLDKLNAVLIPK